MSMDDNVIIDNKSMTKMQSDVERKPPMLGAFKKPQLMKAPKIKKTVMSKTLTKHVCLCGDEVVPSP